MECALAVQRRTESGCRPRNSRWAEFPRSARPPDNESLWPHCSNRNRRGNACLRVSRLRTTQLGSRSANRNSRCLERGRPSHSLRGLACQLVGANVTLAGYGITDDDHFGAFGFAVEQVILQILSLRNTERRRRISPPESFLLAPVPLPLPIPRMRPSASSSTRKPRVREWLLEREPLPLDEDRLRYTRASNRAGARSELQELFASSTPC